MTSAIDVPDHIEEELIHLLVRRYPECEKDNETFRDIDYEKSKNPKVRFKATVIYYGAQCSNQPTFEYIERRNEKTNSYEFYWYCTNDLHD